MSLVKSNPKISEADNNSFTDIKVLYPELAESTREEIIYRRNGRTVDKLIEFDSDTGLKIKTTHYDYFDDKKIRSIDEFDKVTGKKIRTTNFVLYKSIDEFDLKTGKKLRTINFQVKDETKISSIQEYDPETEKIVTISIYKRDGKTVGIVKNIDPETGKVTNWVNRDKDSVTFDISKYDTSSYDNIKQQKEAEKSDIAQLIDNLYRNKFRFGD